MVILVYWRYSNSKYFDFRRVIIIVVDYFGKERDFGLIEFYFFNEEYYVSFYKYKVIGKLYNFILVLIKKFIREVVKGK